MLTVLEKSKYWIAALFGLIAISLPFFGASQYLLRVATNIGIYAILALSLNLITGYAGQVSMGHAAFMAIGAYMAAYLSTQFKILPPEFVVVQNFIYIIAAGVAAAIAGGWAVV